MTLTATLVEIDTFSLFIRPSECASQWSSVNKQTSESGNQSTYQGVQGDGEGAEYLARWRARNARQGHLLRERDETQNKLQTEVPSKYPETQVLMSINEISKHEFKQDKTSAKNPCQLGLLMEFTGR